MRGTLLHALRGSPLTAHMDCDPAPSHKRSRDRDRGHTIALGATSILPPPHAAGRASPGAAVPLDLQRIRPSEPAFTPSWQLWLSISAVDQAAVVFPPKQPLLHDKLSGLLPPAVFTALDATTGMEGSKRVKF